MERGSLTTILVFRVGPYSFSVPATEVKSISSPPPITTIPFAPPSISGSCLLQGKVALIINLHHKLGLPTKPNHGHGQLVFADLDQGTIAFQVDEVIDVIQQTDFRFQSITGIGPHEAFNRCLIKDDSIILHTDLQTLYELADPGLITARLSALGLPDEEAKAQEHGGPATKVDGSGAVGHPAPRPPQPPPPSVAAAQESTHQQDTAFKDALAGSVDEPDVFDLSRLHREAHRNEGRTGEPLPQRPLARESRRQPPLPQPASADKGYRPGPARRSGYAPPPPATGSAGRNKLLPISIGAVLIMVLLAIMILRPTRRPDSADRFIPPAKPLKATQVDRQPPATPVQEVAPSRQQRQRKAPQPPPTPPRPIATQEVATDKAEVFRVETDEFALIVERSPTNASQPPPEKEVKQSGSPTEKVHIVVRGDTLWDIAATYLENPFRYHELARISKIRNPHLIHPGDRIRIIKKKPPPDKVLAP